MVRAIPAPGAGGNPRSFFDKLNDWAKESGAGGLGYITFAGGEPQGPIAKNLERDRAIMESLTAFKRAGASGILTYFALEAARLLNRA